MSLIKKKKKKKPFKAHAHGAGGGQVSTARPVQEFKLAPCIHACPSGNDVRGWLTVIAQREKLKIGLEEALDRAWQLYMETNPLPAIMGRVCPHPCEGSCNREHKDGSVAINSVERSIGDWGIERGLKPSLIDAGGPFDEKIAVVGAGPSGLSCAYQLARRGYKVTLFESFPRPGGMLRYGIPEYRLPRDIIDAEAARIEALGVEFRYDTSVGKDISLEQLRDEYAAVFVGIGAHVGKKLGVPGEDGPGVYTGTDFLRRVNMGDRPPVGSKVVVIGGGDTAIDASRVAKRLVADSAAVSRRMGAEVTILYRRTRVEMPAIEREIEEALEEGIRLEFLAAPAKIIRDENGNVTRMVIQRMELGEPDASGRRRPVPIEGKVDEIDVETVITAVSQAPAGKALGLEGNWIDADDWGRTAIDGIWSGGDNVNLGIATTAIGQGRRAAESIHATLRGLEHPVPAEEEVITHERLLMDWYPPAEPAIRNIAGPEERLADPLAEFDRGITQQQMIDEVARCFSCGSCFGCDNCWMYCTPSCFKKLSEPRPGYYYSVDLSTCDGCKKCAEQCPCGFLVMR